MSPLWSPRRAPGPSRWADHVVRVRLRWVADIRYDTDVAGQGQTVTAEYDYRHGPVSLLTCTFATVMRMG